MTVRRHVALSGDEPAGDLLAATRTAEERGIDAVWVTDVRFTRDCYVLLGAMATATTRIVLAPGVSDPFSRHPASLAAAAATLSELAPGRIILGLGAGGSGLDRIGVVRTDPVRTVEAAIGAIRGLLRGEVAEAETAGFRLTSGRLTFRPAAFVPIALVAHGPVMLRMSGRLADIAFIANYASPGAVEWARGHIARGRDAREATVDGPREIWRIDMCLSEDREAARDVMRRRIRTLLASGYYGAPFLKPLGLDHLAGRADAPDPELDPLVDAVAFAGHPSEAAKRLRELVAGCGFREICYRPYRAPGQTLSVAMALADDAVTAAS